MTTSTSWIENSATHTDNGLVTFEHSSRELPHQVRSVYLDGTPKGSWIPCDDCETGEGNTAVIKGLRAAFEDLEQIACDNSVDKQVSGLLTALHDHFDYWMREDGTHDELATVLEQWLTIAEQHSGITLYQGREAQ